MLNRRLKPFKNQISFYSLTVILLSVSPKSVESIIYAGSYSLNSTVSEGLWPRLRASIANRLVINNILEGNEACQKVFSELPVSGNCWCFPDKRSTLKGEPQDLYSVFEKLSQAAPAAKLVLFEVVE